MLHCYNLKGGSLTEYLFCLHILQLVDIAVRPTADLLDHFVLLCEEKLAINPLELRVFELFAESASHLNLLKY